MTPLGPLHHRARPDARASTTSRSPPAPASPRCSRSSPRCSRRAGRAVTLVYGNRTHRTVMFPEEVARPEGPLPGPAPPGARAVPRDRRTSSCSPAGSTATGCAGSSTRWCRSTTSTSGSCAGRTDGDELRAALVDAGRPTDARVHTELFHVEPGAARAGRTTLAGGRRGRGDGDDPPRRPRSTFDLRPDDVPVLDAALRVALRAAVRLQGRRLRHLPGAGRRGRGGDGPQLRARARRGRAPATCSPASPTRPPTRVVLDYDA